MTFSQPSQQLQISKNKSDTTMNEENQDQMHDSKNKFYVNSDYNSLMLIPTASISYKQASDHNPADTNNSFH